MANEYLFTEFIFMFAQTGVLNFNSLLLWSSYKNDINFPFQVALMSLLILIYFTIYFIIIYNLLSRGYYKAAQRKNIFLSIGKYFMSEFIKQVKYISIQEDKFCVPM